MRPSQALGAERPRLVIGFAAETENLIANATAKRRAKGADWIVANDVWPGTGAMGGDHTQVHLVTPAGVEDWPPMSKDEMAARLLTRAERSLADACARLPNDGRGAPRKRGRPRAALAPWRRACRFRLITPSMPPASTWSRACSEDAPVELAPGARALVPTGFALELPPGFEAQLRPRSGLALKAGVTY